MVFGILKIAAGLSLSVIMSGQKLQVKRRSKCMQELSPGSALNPAIQALLLIGDVCGIWAWPGLGCAALTVRI